MSAALVTQTIRDALSTEKVTGGLSLHSETKDSTFTLPFPARDVPMTNRPWKLSLVRSSPNVCIGFVMRLVLRLKNRLLSTFTSATLNASTSKTASLPTKSRARPRNLTLFYDGLFFLSSTLPGTVKRCKATFNAHSSLLLTSYQSISSLYMQMPYFRISSGTSSSSVFSCV